MTIKDLKKRFDTAVSDRQAYEPVWEDTARFTLMVKEPFQTELSKGSFLNDGSLFANIGVVAARTFSTAILGACWRGGAISCKLSAPAVVKPREYSGGYDKELAVVSDEFAYFTDHPDVKLLQALQTVTREYTIYGTAAAMVVETDTFPFIEVRSIPLKSLYLTKDEDERFVVREMSGRQFGEEYPDTGNYTEPLKAKLGKDETKIKVVQHIFKRRKIEAEAGYKAKKYGALIFLPEELTDKKEPIIVEENGYDTMPVKVVKCNKVSSEIYGRGLSADALPSLMEFNTCKELFAVGTEFKVEPIMWSYATSFNRGMFNKTPGAINIPNMGGINLPGGAPIAPIYTIGSMQELASYIATVEETIKEHFYIDKLFDLNNDSRMTLGEAMIRKGLRDDSVSMFYLDLFSIIGPILSDMLDILVDKGLIVIKIDQDIALRAATLGIKPYEIEFTSSAARSLRSADLKNFLDLFGVMANAQGLFPTILDHFNEDKFARFVPGLTHTPESLLREENEVVMLRAKRAKLMAEQAALDQQDQEAGTNQKNAQALASVRDSQTGPFADEYSDLY